MTTDAPPSPTPDALLVPAAGTAPQSLSVAFIPARAGSERVPDKNIRRLGGHPLIAYSIAAARQSQVFDAVVVATDSERYARIARHYGAETPFLRPAAISGSTSPDIEWIECMLDGLRERDRTFAIFSILRPTSPFRLPETIQRAMGQFLEDGRADSLRAVEPCRQHPGKMWVIRENRLLPLFPFGLGPGDQPWHSTQTKALPEIHVQNASLEIAWTRVVTESRTIAGTTVQPFLTRHPEGVDINAPEDWFLAERLLDEGLAKLPIVPEAPWAEQS